MLSWLVSFYINPSDLKSPKWNMWWSWRNHLMWLLCPTAVISATLHLFIGVCTSALVNKPPYIDKHKNWNKMHLHVCAHTCIWVPPWSMHLCVCVYMCTGPYTCIYQGYVAENVSFTTVTELFCTEYREWSWCCLCRHRRHRKLSLWQPPVQSVMHGDVFGTGDPALQWCHF